MLNFAINGILEPYVLRNRDPLVNPIAKTNSVSKVDERAEDFSLTDQQLQPPPSKSAVVQAAYQNRGGEPGKRQSRRAWLVKDLMTSTVITLKPEDSIRDAWDVHLSRGFRHIPITSNIGQIVGILSDRDLLRLGQPKQTDHDSAVSTIMTTRVLTCFSDTPLRLAASVMLENGFSSLPVIAKDQTLQGILTTGDILSALVNEAPLDLWV